MHELIHAALHDCHFCYDKRDNESVMHRPVTRYGHALPYACPRAPVVELALARKRSRTLKALLFPVVNCSAYVTALDRTALVTVGEVDTAPPPPDTPLLLNL